MVRLIGLLAATLVLGACATGAETAGPPVPAGTGDGAATQAPPTAGPGGKLGEDPGEDATATAGAGVTAVATVFPLAWMAREIAPAADHTYLAARGQDPHDLELTPGDRALIETADVVVYMGELGFQPQVETAVSGREGITVDARAVAGDGTLLAYDHDHDGDGHDHDHDGDDHGHDHDDDHDGDERYDPHLWFDATIMADVALEIGEAFARADAAGADAYRGAARALHDELRALGADLDALLSGCTHRTAIVSHEAYAYLLAPRGLAQEGISGAGGHGEASPQRLAEMTQRIRDEGITAVLAEPVEGRADAEALAREAGVDLLEIDPLEIAGDGALATGYTALLRQQAERFAQALDCG